ncbi:MAG: hypothetical protein HZA51_03400 [Planctomycetes bacterium]|nr:hypothetical protein [Planctomycetota bacterium]
MSDEKTTGPKSRLTIHHLSLRQKTSSALHLLTLGSGMFISFFVGMALGSGCLKIGWRSASTSIDVLASLLCGFGASALFALALQRLDSRKRKRVACHAHGSAQQHVTMNDPCLESLPAHIEQLMREFTFYNRILRKAVTTIPPGHAVWINAKRPDNSVDPISTDIYFEPIELSRDIEQLVWLCMSNLEVRERQQPALPSKAQNPPASKSRAKKFANAASQISVLTLQLCWLVIMIYDAVTKGLSIGSVVPFLLVSGWVFAWIRPLFLDRQWFLIPGGILLREVVLFPRSDTFRVISPMTHGILIDERHGVAAINDLDRTLRIACPGGAAWAILAAWLSTARTPTESEIRTFLGLPVQADCKTPRSH